MTAVMERIRAGLIPQGDCLVWTGAKNDVGYGQIKVGGRRGRVIYVHRLVFEDAHGALQADQQVDHIGLFLLGCWVLVHPRLTWAYVRLVWRRGRDYRRRMRAARHRRTSLNHLTFRSPVR